MKKYLSNTNVEFQGSKTAGPNRDHFAPFFQNSCLAFFYLCAQVVEICFLVLRKYDSQLWRNIPNSAHFAPSAAHSCVYFNFLCSHEKKLCLWERCELKDTHITIRKKYISRWRNIVLNCAEIYLSVKKYISRWRNINFASEKYVN